MTSSSGKQIFTIHTPPNISESKKKIKSKNKIQSARKLSQIIYSNIMQNIRQRN